MGRLRIIAAVTQPSIHHVIRALAEDGRTGAMDLAEHAVDSVLATSPTAADKALTVDILLRDLASLRGVAPHIAGFIGRIEARLAGVRREALLRPAPRPVPADHDEPAAQEPALQAA